MTIAVIDSTVIIHLFRRNAAAHQWVTQFNQPLSITPITWLEVMYGAGSKTAQTVCKEILQRFELVYLTAGDMDWAMNQLERYRLSNGIGINDCLIASVCYRLEIPLYTHNLRDMTVILDQPFVIKPY